MPQLLTHPPLDTLRAYALGKLNADAATAVEEHITVCAECGRILSEQPEDSFQRLAQKAAPAAPPAGPDRGTAVFVPTADSDRTIPPGAPPADPSATIPPSAANVGTAAGGPGDRTVVGGERRPAVPSVPPELADHPRYQVIKVLGEGGMGAVYAAQHLKMDRKVALKVIHAHLISRGDALPRFLQEVRAAAKLSHPNIVQAYDADEAGDLHFLVMEYVEGTDLSKFLQKKGPLPVNLACHFIRQAALGLQHAHEQGMIHRDIKPHNLMLTPKGQVKILDFGLARFAKQGGPADGQLTGTGVVMGTADYIAPEQTKDARTIDIRADIYSLGCTLYQLLSGRVPFPDGSVIDKMIKHALETPPALAGLRPDLPPALVQVIGRMMAKNPDDRFATPADVARALTPFVTSKPTGSGVLPPVGGASGSDPTRGAPVPAVSPAPTPASAPKFEVVADEDERDLANTPGPARGKKQPRQEEVQEDEPRPVWKRPGVLAVVAVLLVAFLAAAGVGVYRILTPEGELVIETVCDDVDVVVKQGGKVVAIIDTRSNKTVTLRGGKYQLELELGKDGKPRDDVTIDIHEADIKRGEKVIATVRRVPKKDPPAVVPKTDPKPPVGPGNPGMPPVSGTPPTPGPDVATLLAEARNGLSTNVEVAAAKATEVIKLDPKSAEAHRIRSAARVALKDYAGAEADAEALISLAPLTPDGLTARALARGHAGRFREAIADYDALIDGDVVYPGRAFALRCRGFLRERLGDDAGAVRDEQLAVKIDPKLRSFPNPFPEPKKEEPNGSTLPTPFDSKVLFREVKRFGPNDAVVRKGAVSPDGTLVAASLYEGDGGDSYLGVFELPGGRRVLKEALLVHDLAWGPNQQLYVVALYSGGNRLIRLDLKDPNPRPTSFASVGVYDANIGGHDVAVSPDGTRVAVHDALADKRGRITVYDSSGKELARLEGGPIPAADFQELAPGLTTWRGSVAREMARSRHQNALAFSPDGKLLACAHADRILRVWDVANKREAWKLPGLTNAGAGVLFLADGKLLVGGGGVGLRAVDPRSPAGGGFVLAEAPKPQKLPGGVKVDIPGFDPSLLDSLTDSGLVRGIPIPGSSALLALSLGNTWKVFGPDGRSVDVDGPNQLFGDCEVRLIGLTPDGKQAVVCYLTDSDDLRAQKRGGGLRDAPGQLGLWDVNPVLRQAK